MKRSLLAASLLLSACNGEFSEFIPTVSFSRLDVNEVDWESADTDFVFNVDNPNPLDITLATFDYTLAFEGEEWAFGDDPDGLTLGASGTSEIALPVGLVFQDLYDMVQAVRGEDTIAFELAGSFGFNTPIGLIKVPYDAGGDFPALRTPNFGFEGLRVADLDLSGATLELDLAVDNDHGSTLDFTNFDYDFALEGYEVGSGSVATLGAVQGANTGTLTLPLDIDFLGAGSAAYELFSTLLSGEGSVDVGLNAATDVDTPFGLIPLSVDETGRVSLSGG